jgi:hypothetical protein
MSYQPGDHFTLPIQATRPGSSRSSLTRPRTLPSYSAYGYPEQLPFAGQGMQGGNLHQAAFLAEILRLQQPQQISPQQYPPCQGPAIDNIGQQAPSELPDNLIPQYRQPAAVEAFSNQFSLQQYYAPTEPASSYNLEMNYSPMGPANTQEQQQIMPSMDEAYNRYQQQLMTTFKAISDGRLAEASVKIMDLSRWFLTNIAKLGELLSALRAG